MKNNMKCYSLFILPCCLALTILLTLMVELVAAQDIDLDGTIVEASGLESVDAVDTVTKTYVATTDFIVNPERGMLSQIEVYASDPSTYNEFASNNLKAQFTNPSLGNERKSLVLCLFYLDSFTETNTITSEFIEVIRNSFNNIRSAGLKCVLRFAYTTRWEDQPYGDVDEARMFKHLTTLKSVIRPNADIIMLMQMGQIGAFGEGYYTDYYGYPIDELAPNSPFYAKRLGLLNELLVTLPVTRSVMIRTPYQKQNMFGITTALAPSLAYTSDPIARSGHFNDCFLADDTDQGTYRRDQITQDKDYLAEETKYVPMGGETCENNPAFVTCSNALAELARFHWTFLKREWEPDAMNALSSCLPTIKNKLGYRLELTSATFPNSVRPGGTFALNIQLQNSGYAAPINQRPVKLILRRVGSTTPAQAYVLKVDPRKWLPGNVHAITDLITIPCNLPVGSYELLLNLPDPNLSGEPAYSIRFANRVDNVDVWEPITGYNKLGFTLSIAQPSGVVGQYCQDFQGPQPKANWRYLWNSSAILNQTSSYTPLIWDGVSAYDFDGIPGFATNNNLGYGHLRSSSGHPGLGTIENQPFDRYVIAAYTVTAPGSYAITNSRITDADKNGGNGAQVCIFTNRTTTIQCLTYDNGGAKIFDRPLGTLKLNDIIFVAIGPRDSAIFDAFNWDFSISLSSTAANAEEEETEVSLFLPIVIGEN